MIDYNFQGRLTYLPGGSLDVQMSAWPAVSGGNWWVPTTGSATCVGAYQAIGAASLAASYVNLANPGTYDLTAGNAPGWSAGNGWEFDGNNDYLATGYTPAGDRNSSVLVRFSNHDGGDYDVLFGQWTGIKAEGRYMISPDWVSGATGVLYSHLGEYALPFSPSITNGVVGFANNIGYRNGTKESGTMGSQGGSISYPLFIGCWNNKGTAANFFAGYIQAIAFYSTVLSDTQMSEVTTAMAAL